MVSFSLIADPISGGMAEPMAGAQEMDRPAESDHGDAQDRLPGPAGEEEGEDHTHAGQEEHGAPGMEGRLDQRPGSPARRRSTQARPP